MAAPVDHEYVCATCGAKFKWKCNMVRHERKHAGIARFICCGKHFNSKGDITLHRCNVHGETKQHVCTLCGKSFATNARLRRHKRSEEKRLGFKCDVCGHTTEDVAKLNDHKSMHAGDRKHRCTICNKIYRYSSGLSAHKRKQHKDN